MGEGDRGGDPGVPAGTEGGGIGYLAVCPKHYPYRGDTRPYLAPGPPSPRRNPYPIDGSWIPFPLLGGGLRPAGGWQEYRVSISPGTIHTIVLLTFNH